MLVSAVVLIAGLGVTAFGVRHQLTADTINAASLAARQTSVLVEKGPLTGPLPTMGAVHVQVVDTATGRVILSSPALDGEPPVSTKGPEGGGTRIDDETCTEQRCGYVVGFRMEQSPHGAVTVLAMTRKPVLLNGQLLESALALLGLALLGMVAWGTWRGIGRTLRPVEQIRASLEKITASDLSRRVPATPGHDEIAHLVHTVNATLDHLECAVGRLEQSAEHQRRFASDASHELRTPLTGLRTRIEVALHDPDDSDLLQTLKDALGDADRLHDIVDDLLALARLDAGAEADREPVDLAELVRSEISRRAWRTPMTTELQHTIVTANRLQLARLLGNLLANADRHADSAVFITVRAVGDEAVLEVQDDGDGIPEADRETIFRRFARLDSARSRDAGGTGLGLPIARDIATAHGGQLYAADAVVGRGARLVVHLPLTVTGP